MQSAPKRAGGGAVGEPHDAPVDGGQGGGPGAGELESRREAAGHGSADDGAHGHAGEEHAPGEQPVGRDAHQAGPLQRARRSQTTVRNKRK